jgi:hypothetical protein
MRFKSFDISKLGKLSKLIEKFDRDTTEADDTATIQATVLEEVKNRTMDLEKSEKSEQPEEVANTASHSEGEENTTPKPHGPLSELTVEPENGLQDAELEAETPVEEADEEVNVVKIGAEEAAPAEAESKAEKEPEKEDDDSLGNLFSQEEEEENPLASLLNSLPDVTAQELLDDAQEITEMMRELHQK